MADATELAKLLVGFLHPALPFLLKIGEKVGEGIGADAVKALGKGAWGKARNIWVKLGPQVQQKGSAQQAVTKMIERPDEVSQFTLISEIRDILESNPELASELLNLMQDRDSESDDAGDKSINLQTGGISIRGNFNNTGGTFVGGDQVNLGNK
jgi:hypothetical protein